MVLGERAQTSNAGGVEQVSAGEVSTAIHHFTSHGQGIRAQAQFNLIGLSSVLDGRHQPPYLGLR